MRVRPTADRVKEALFNILANIVEDISEAGVLDIFAGTGSLGIEALSRGAGRAVFIDNHRQSVGMIEKNLQLLGFKDRSEILVDEAVSALKYLEKQGQSFKIIFLDPPYGTGHTEKVLDHLSQSVLVEDDTIIIAEFSSLEDIPDRFGRLREFDRRIYGDTAVGLFSKHV